MAFLAAQQLNGACSQDASAAALGRDRATGIRLVLAAWLAIYSVAMPSVHAQGHSREYPLKAVFLLNFARFTDWPTNAFNGPDSPLVIGVLGADPFGSVLDLAIKDEQVKGRKFVVARYSRLSDVGACHILFISQSEAQHLDKIETTLKARPILTVSDIDRSADDGVCEQFVTENNKIRLRTNTDSLKDANLTMSSKLLRLAEIIAAPPK